ncbi:MAG: hypothetical protein K8R79_09720 [Calditrichales bacterium]|nr:hypothetical protein [Calditrichales bacterium]
MKKLMTFLLILPLLFIESNCTDKNPLQAEKSANVALYSDQGCWEESVQAAEKMIQWMELTVEIVDADYINNLGLNTFDLVLIPGGDMYQYSLDLSSQGKKNIRNFISNGGGYIGICGGAYFAAKTVIWQGNQLPMNSLGLYSGTSKGPINEIVPYPDYGMCKVNIVDTTHSITQSEPEFTWILYYSGPVLLPDKDANVTILGRYDRGNKDPAILAFDYGKGRVFLIGTHPEIEEDSGRDGVDWGDELDDQGSDWDLMKKAAEWCLKK